MRAMVRTTWTILIRFPDSDSERKALGYLAGRFSSKSWATGEMIVPEAALARMAVEGIRYNVEGRATYQQLVPPRSFTAFGSMKAKPTGARIAGV
jgi:hypothetical protein